MPASLTNKARRYPLSGALLALGAPAGLLALRWLLAGAPPPLAWAPPELAGDWVTYFYSYASTTAILVALGIALGRAADRLRRSSATDPLTGLFNRGRLRELLETEIRRARRTGAPLSLLLADVDGLKRINDEAGHEAGDAAIIAVSHALRQSCRSTDTPARWGGDEFAILAPETGAADALKLAHRIRASLQELSPEVRVSIGVTDDRRAGGLEAHALYSSADEALYKAKDQGRDRAALSERSQSSTEDGGEAERVA